MKLTKKSQEERAVYCRRCYVPMKKQLNFDAIFGDLVFGETRKLKKGEKLEATSYDWICEKCGLVHTVVPSRHTGEI